MDQFHKKSLAYRVAMTLGPNDLQYFRINLFIQTRLIEMILVIETANDVP